MLTVHYSGAICKSQTYLDNSTLPEPFHCKIANVNLPNHTIVSLGHIKSFCTAGLYTSSLFPNGGTQLKVHHVPQHTTSKRWLVNCQLQDTASSDDEYRSSRNIAISLFKRYKNVIDRGGGDNLKDFIGAGVNAYALGCTDEGLRKELTDMKESGFQIEAMQTYGGSTSLKSKICYEEISECIMWLSIIFITILCTPQPTIVRWSSTSPVSDEMKNQWKGFCAIIANAYYVRGMAWLPVKTLQLEQLAVSGSAEEPSVVASRMRLVFSTLEVVSPQWPRV